MKKATPFTEAEPVETSARIPGLAGTRRSRGWRTAARADAETPHWSLRVRRSRFYQAASCACRQAVLDSTNKRARRRAERHAILHTLEQFNLIRWNRGILKVNGGLGGF